MNCGRRRPATDGRKRRWRPALSHAAGELAAVLPRFPDPFTLPDSASNEWAVDGRHTATGAPLLAGDPHLAFGFPGIWYLARIETPDGVLAGATAPGVPFLVLGHNGHIAWTFTTTGADVQDVFIETPAGDGQYQTPDGPRPFAVREERIKVRGEPDQVLIGARDAPWPGDERPARQRRTDPGRGDGQSGARQHRGRRPARAQSGARRGRRRQGRRDDHRAGAEPAGGRSRAHRALRHRPRADPPRRRRFGPGAGRRLARLDRLGLGRAVAAHRGSRERPAGQRQRPHRTAGLSRCSSAATGSATGAPPASANCSVGPTATPRPTSPACRSMCIRTSPARCCRCCCRAGHRGHRPARPATAARLGWQHDHRRAAAADLQRLDARLLRPRAAAGRHHR